MPQFCTAYPQAHGNGSGSARKQAVPIAPCSAGNVAGNFAWYKRLCFQLGQREGYQMEHYGAIWDVAAGTFIAVSLFTGMAYIIASAVHAVPSVF